MIYSITAPDGRVFEGEDLEALTSEADAYTEELFRKTPVAEQPTQEPKHMPSFFELAKNIAKDGTRIIQSGFASCDEDTYQTRYNLCLACEHLSDNRCTLCGCWMQVKARFEITQCKIGKW